MLATDMIARSIRRAVCDAKLLDYLDVSVLAWRRGLLMLLLHTADSRKDVINEVGTLYGQFLDRHTMATLQSIHEPFRL